MKDPEFSQTIIVGKRKAISTPLVRFTTLIDPVKGVYKLEELILGLFRSGKFVRLPKLDYVLVRRASFQPACEACVVGEDEKLFYQLSLVYRRNRRIITHESKNRDEVLAMARLLAERLNLKLRDLTAVLN